MNSIKNIKYYAFINKNMTQSKTKFIIYRTNKNNSHELISLDVVLFINVAIDLAILEIKNKWSFIKNNTKIPKDKFLIALNLIFNSTYFTFTSKIYLSRLLVL